VLLGWGTLGSGQPSVNLNMTPAYTVSSDRGTVPVHLAVRPVHERGADRKHHGRLDDLVDERSR
jgi:hypothetical protein